jgi:hypothetical protein
MFEFLSNLGSGIGNTISNIDWGGIAKGVLPAAVSIGGQYLASKNQADMMKDYAAASRQAWNDYLARMQPSASEKAASYNAQMSDIASQGTQAARRLNNTLAARGIRGRGTVSPNVNLQSQIMDASNDAYNNVYGIENRYPYGTPTQTPTFYYPSTGNLMGTSLGQTANYWAPQFGV